MDQDRRRLPRDERLETTTHRILPLGPARHRRQEAQPGGCGAKQVLVLGADDDLYTGDPGMVRKGFDGMTQHRLPAERQILLRPFASKPAATAGFDNKRICRILRGILPDPVFLRQTNGCSMIIWSTHVALQ